MISQDVLAPEIDFALDPLPDFHDYAAHWREEGRRVVKVRYLGGEAWIILRYEDVQALYRDEAGLPAAAAYRRHSEPAQGKTLLAMEGDQHRINRLLVSRDFHPPAIERIIPTVLIPLANELIDGFADQRELDIVAEFTYRYPFKVISRRLGIPVEDEKQLHQWLEGLFLYPWDPEKALQARADITAYLEPIVEARRSEPGDDLISVLVQAEAEGHRLSNEEIFSFIRLIYPAGADTTYLSIGSMLYEVLSKPAVAERLRREPQLRQQTVEEALRKHGAVCLQPRYTEKAVTIAGVDIPADSVLLYGNATANHDPDMFENPEAFQVERCPRKIMTFGAGPHFCLGSHLARAELRVSLSLLLDRLQGLRLAEGEPPQITNAILRGPRQMRVAFDNCLPAAEVEETLARL